MFEILDFLPLPIFVTDARKAVLFANQCARDTYGYTGESFLGQPCGQAGEAGFHTVPLGSLPEYGEAYMVWRPSGGFLPKNKSVISNLIETMPCGLMECRGDLGLELIYANEIFYELYGYTRGQASSEGKRSWLDFIHPDDREMIGAMLTDSYSRGRRQMDFEFRGLSREGETVWSFGCVYISEEKGAGAHVRPVLGVLLSGIGETRLRVKSLEEKNAAYRLALLNSTVVLWEYDIRTNTLRKLDGAQDEACGIFGDRDRTPEEIVAGRFISPENAGEYLEMYKLLREGARSSGCTIQVRDDSQHYRWFRISYTNVFGRDGKPERAVGITEEVTAEKNAQLRYLHERQYRASMTTNAIFAYETNLTRDKLISGNVEWLDGLSLTGDTCYTTLIERAREKVTVPEQKVDFDKVLRREALLKAYEEGRREVQCEYNRLNLQNVSIWVRTVVNMIQDPASGDIFGYIYIKDIDGEKRQELELKQKAERDPLTGLYNRGTARYKINALLKEYSRDISAFLMIDIDNFKSVNDTFGHTYGDAVLSELAHKLKSIVRANDIAVRVGGDEMAVFFCNIKRKREVFDRAEEICKALHMNYSSGGSSLVISGSIGLAFAPEHGTTFDALYERADIALYHAKNRGKNQYVAFDGGLSMDMNKETQIDRNFNKNFSENISEFIFKILYHSNNLEFSVESVLELLSKHYDAQYSYIIQYDEDTRKFFVAYEWRESGVKSHRDDIGELSYKFMDGYWKNFDEDGIFYVEDTSKLVFDHRIPGELMEKLKVRSLLQCAINIEGYFRGFIGVDNFRGPKHYTEEQQNTLKFSAEIIGTFLSSKQAERDRERHMEAVNTVLDNLGTYLYVVDPENMRIIYMNQKLRRGYPEARTGMKCHELFRDGKEPCETCPIRELIKTGENRCSIEVYNDLKGIWLEASAKWIKWLSGEDCCLVSCFDITKFKK